MALVRIVLADLDEGYIAPLQKRLLDIFGYDIQLHVITDAGYLNQFFAQPQSIDVLIIGEALYGEGIDRHNIGTIFLLCDEITGFAENGSPYRLYRYGSAKDLADAVANQTRLASGQQGGTVQVIAVYGAAGGEGKTTLSAALCNALAKHFRRSLFIGADSLQTFGGVFPAGDPLPPGIEKVLLEKSTYAYEKIKPLLRHESFDNMPPFASSLASLGLDTLAILHLVELAKQSGDYNYIVVDLDAGFSADTTSCMAAADKVLLVSGQSTLSTHKTACLLANIDCSDTSRFVLACNRYTADESNPLAELAAGYRFPVEYIDRNDSAVREGIEAFAATPAVQRLAQLFL